MTQDELKKDVGWAALKYIKPGSIVGIGTGSTISYFIDALATIKNRIKGTVSSSNRSSEKLKSLNISVIYCNEIDSLDIYVDSADEIDKYMNMIKGGGGALTQEKIISCIAETFICIVDQSKFVKVLGKFPLPVEVIPMASNYVARELIKLGGIPKHRKNLITDNGNIILDVHNLSITNPVELENSINKIAGVVTVGLFANRSADIAIIGTQKGIKIKHKSYFLK
ncbi:Ribose-5-phosphate isomerase A [Candidatus Providencia siddallii]|uniref:Ribose-5-phosphate isomerase A n=1 Tax=Candidatus Providencia siddallii TaxID=1715285 RepID=A0A0M6W9V8_9GAMM|nr:Ribose-5-phosphate isomerase A [Candidatus Providencia siddallii]